MAMQEDDWRRQYADVQHLLDGSHRLRVPLMLEFSGVGRNWWDALQGE
jgi:hypothetical protein